MLRAQSLLSAATLCVMFSIPTETQTNTEEVMDKKDFTVLSWNIEGLANDDLALRTQVCMTDVVQQSPTVVCFQEVMLCVIVILEIAPSYET